MKQVEAAALSPNADIIILGDSNLDANKWRGEKFLHAKVAKVFFNTIEQNGLSILNVGNTYMADHAQANGNVAESALDHAYVRIGLNKVTEITKIENSSSDHLPVIISISSIYKKKIYTRQVTKRTFKNFNKENWNAELNRQDWSKLESSSDIQNMENSLDKVAPFKTFKVKSQQQYHYFTLPGFGLTGLISGDRKPVWVQVLYHSSVLVCCCYWWLTVVTCLWCNCGSDSLKATFKNDGVVVWNQTPETIKECNSLEIARKCIKTFVKTLPF